MYAPVGDVPWPVATLGQVIENQTGGATVAARFLSSDANVEVLAISRISVQRIDELGSDGISLKNSGGAIKSHNVYIIQI
jgi:hypothetical protein